MFGLVPPLLMTLLLAGLLGQQFWHRQQAGPLVAVLECNRPLLLLVLLIGGTWMLWVFFWLRRLEDLGWHTRCRQRSF